MKPQSTVTHGISFHIVSNGDFLFATEEGVETREAVDFAENARGVADTLLSIMVSSTHRDESPAIAFAAKFLLEAADAAMVASIKRIKGGAQ
ncbi:MAG: hypothetical protein QM741_17080 [Rudaea sp.]|uniref:hypothetical protein n=1 Tax=Rudaea sp. TaxID=2136325 RepID=UPI0039E3A020